MTSAERQRRFIAKREAKAADKAAARPDPYGLGPIVQVEALRQRPTSTASWLRDKLGDQAARAVHAALGQAIEGVEPEGPAAKAGGATDDQARALDEALAKLDAEIERSGTTGPKPKPPQPGEWCMAFSAAGLEAITARLAALKARVGELEADAHARARRRA
jgi:hypothetical protein